MASFYDTIMQQAMAKAAEPMHHLADAARDTLAQINSQRAAEGFPLLDALPNAIRGNTAQCLYARGYGDMAKVSVGGEGTMTFEDTEIGRRLAFGLSRAPGARLIDSNTVKAPSMFASVISAFDGNQFPEYRPDADDPYYST
jgi:hypothetical protein